MANVEHVESSKNGVMAKAAVLAVKVGPSAYAATVVSSQYGEEGPDFDLRVYLGRVEKDTRRPRKTEWRFRPTTGESTFGPTLSRALRAAGFTYLTTMHTNHEES